MDRERLREACEQAVGSGAATRIGESGIVFNKRVTMEDLAEVNRSYGEAFERRRNERLAKEQEAWRKLFRKHPEWFITF